MDVDTGLAKFTTMFKAVAPKIKHEKEIAELKAKRDALCNSIDTANRDERTAILTQIMEISDTIDAKLAPPEDDTEQS